MPASTSRPFTRGVVLGVAGAVVGLLTWLVTGARLPLQNLWAVEVMPADMPRALLPFGQDYLTLIAGIFAVAGLCAGALLRRRPAGSADAATSGNADLMVRPAPSGPILPVGRTSGPHGGVWAAVVGYLLVAGIAIAQTATVVGNGLEDSRIASQYLSVLVAWSTLCAALGLLVLLLVAQAPRPVAALAMVLALIVGAGWLTHLLSNLHAPDLARYAHLLVAVGVGLVVAWCGWRPLRHLLVWVLGLGALVVVPAALTAVSYLGGSLRSAGALRSYDGVGDFVRTGGQVFRRALELTGTSREDVAIAFIVAALLTPGWSARSRASDRPKP